MSVEEIERVIAQRVANAIEAIAIYETKTILAHKAMSQTEQREKEVVENASNKRRWEGNHNGSLSQQNKGHKVSRAHTAWPINKKAYDGSLPLCNQCKLHHSGPCTNQRTRTCYECGSLGHYKSECPIVKFHEHMDTIHERMRASKPKTMQDATETTTKLRNKKIGTLVECQTEKKHYSGSKPLCSKCNYHHDGPCAPKCHQCNRFCHLACDYRSSIKANTTNIQKDTGANQKATCYECGNQGHYMRDCLERKNQNQENQIKSTKARRV
nr:hypothetical protein [Tanacetum cinerariifolium]